jgi:hypothetical protein
MKNASRDWRTRCNFLVFGSPFVRFYAAVPLLFDNTTPIGVLAVFDQCERSETPQYLVERLIEKVRVIMASIMDGNCVAIDVIGDSIYFQTRHTVPETNYLSVDSSDDFLSPVGIASKLRHWIYLQLAECADTRNVACRAAYIMCRRIRLDMAYVAEVRVSLVFEVTREQGSLDWNNELQIYKFLDLQSPVRRKVRVRRLG